MFCGDLCVWQRVLTYQVVWCEEAWTDSSDVSSLFPHYATFAATSHYYTYLSHSLFLSAIFFYSTFIPHLNNAIVKFHGCPAFSIVLDIKNIILKSVNSNCHDEEILMDFKMLDFCY